LSFDQSETNQFNTKYSHDLAAYLLLSHAGVYLFFIIASGETNPVKFVSVVLDFVLAVLILHDHLASKVFALVKAFAGLILVFFIFDVGDPYSARWYEAFLAHPLFVSSFVLLLLGHRVLWCFILGGILAFPYLLYLAFTVFIRFNV